MAQGGATLGDLAAFLLYINLFQSPLSQLGQAANLFQSASAAAGAFSNSSKRRKNRTKRPPPTLRPKK